MLVSQLDLLDLPTHGAPSARAARPTSPSSGTDKEPNSSPSFGGKLLPFLIELNLLGINSLLLRKGCHSGHPSPLLSRQWDPLLTSTSNSLPPHTE